MTRQNAVQTQQQQASSASPLSRGGILQRQCDGCGQHTIAGGECGECGKKKIGLQRKLTIGASNDPLELEADRIADRVMSASPNSVVNSAPPRIQRFTGQTTGQAGMVAPASVDSVLSSPGSPLESGLQQDMGQRFGHDFSRVRVHTDAAAERSAREVNANAYTVGQNIVFGAGRFTPATHEGRRLIAHELTHVVQQHYATADSPLSVARPGDRSELEVDSTLQQVLSVGTIPQFSHTGLALQRDPNDQGPHPNEPADMPRTHLTKTQLDLLAKARKFYNLPTGGPTESVRTIVGVLITKDGEVMFIKSGVDGGHWGGTQRGGIPRGRGEAFTGGGASQGNIATHVEGHAAAIMHQRGLTTAELIIEESPCKVCDNRLTTALPPGSNLTVIDPQATGKYSDSHSLVTPPGTPAKPLAATTTAPKPPPSNTTSEEPRIRVSDAPPRQPVQPANVAEPPPSQPSRIYQAPKLIQPDTTPASEGAKKFRVSEDISPGKYGPTKPASEGATNVRVSPNIIGDEETSPASGNLEPAKPAAKKFLTTPPVIKKAIIAAGGAFSEEGTATAANKAETTSVAPQQPTSGASAIAPGKITPQTSPPTSAKPSIKPTVPVTTPVTPADKSAASPVGTSPKVTPRVKTITQAPSTKSPTEKTPTATPAVTSARPTFSARLRPIASGAGIFGLTLIGAYFSARYQEMRDQEKFEKDMRRIDSEIDEGLQGLATTVADLEIDEPSRQVYVYITLIGTSVATTQNFVSPAIAPGEGIISQSTYWGTNLIGVGVGTEPRKDNESVKVDRTAPMLGFGGLQTTTYTTSQYSKALEKIPPDQLRRRILEQVDKIDQRATTSHTIEQEKENLHLRERLRKRLVQLPEG